MKIFSIPAYNANVAGQQNKAQSQVSHSDNKVSFGRGGELKAAYKAAEGTKVPTAKDLIDYFARVGAGTVEQLVKLSEKKLGIKKARVEKELSDVVAGNGVTPKEQKTAERIQKAYNEGNKEEIDRMLEHNIGLTKLVPAHVDEGIWIPDDRELNKVGECAERASDLLEEMNK